MAKPTEGYEAIAVAREGVLLPTRRPMGYTLLRDVAAATVFAFTLTSILPSGWAQGTVSERGLSPEEESHLRGLSTKESPKVEAGLEETLTGTEEREPSMSRRAFLRIGAGAVLSASTFVELLGQIADAEDRVISGKLPDPNAPPSTKAEAFLYDRQVVQIIDTVQQMPEVGYGLAPTARSPGEAGLPVTYQVDRAGSRLLQEAIRKEAAATGKPVEGVSQKYFKGLGYWGISHSTYAAATAAVAWISQSAEEKDPGRKKDLLANARWVLAALARLERKTGRIGYSSAFGAEGQPDDSLEMGTTAWVGEAFVLYQKLSGDTRPFADGRTAAAIAEGLGKTVLDYQKKGIGDAQRMYTGTGLVPMGSREGKLVPWGSTEYNVDAFFFLRDLAALSGKTEFSAAAERIAAGIEKYLWDSEKKRFRRGFKDDEQVLDANSWGALFLLARGRADDARAIWDYVESTFRREVAVEGVSEPLIGYAPAPRDEFVWSEGSFGVAALARRLGEEEKAQEIEKSLTRIQVPLGGYRYAYPPAISRGSDGGLFSPYPDVASTAWSLIARSPVFWAAQSGLEEPLPVVKPEPIPEPAVSAPSPAPPAGYPSISLSLPKEASAQPGPAPQTIWERRGTVTPPISLPTVDQGSPSKAFRRLETLLQRAARAEDLATLLGFSKALSLESPADNTRALRVQVLQKLAELYRFTDIDLLSLEAEDPRLTAGNRLRRAAGLPVLAFERHWEDRGYLVQKALLGSKAGKAIVLARADSEGLMGMSEAAIDRIRALRDEGTDVTVIHLGNVTPGAYLRQASTAPGQGSLTVVVPAEDRQSLRMEFTDNRALTELMAAGIPPATILNGAVSLGTKNRADLYLADATVQKGLNERRQIDLAPAEQTEKNSRERFGVGTAVAVGLVAGAALLGGAADSHAGQAADAGVPNIVSVPDAGAAAVPPMDLARPPVVMKITIDKESTPGGEEHLNVSAQSTPSDRVAAPPTLVSRSAIRSAMQEEGGFLARVHRAVRLFLLGPDRAEKWSAAQQKTSNVVPQRREVLFSINKPREFLEQGADVVDATLAALGRSAKEQGSRAALAFDIGGYVDFRGYQDQPSPVAQTLVKQWVLPLVEKARANGIKIVAYSSARGAQADMGSYVTNLKETLGMGFHPEEILLDWEIWASSVGQPSEWESVPPYTKRQMAAEWLYNHQRVLNEVIPEAQATPSGKPARLYTLVNADFARVLREVLGERGETLPERLHLILTAYDYPPGREAQAAAAQFTSVQAQWEKPLGIAFNFVPSSDPSLHRVARGKGRAGQVIQETLNRINAKSPPVVFEHLSTQDLTHLLKHGTVPPQLLTADTVEKILGTSGAVGSMVVGLPPGESLPERKLIPVAEPTQEKLRRYLVEPRGYGLLAGAPGVGSLIRAPWSNFNTWFHKGVWWFLDPDTLVWGPEAGLTVAALKTVVGTLAGGELEVTKMDLAVTPLDESGNPSGPEQVIENMFGLPDPVVDLKRGRWKGELRVMARRPNGQLHNGKQLLPIVTNIEAEVSLNIPGSSQTPRVSSEAVNLSSLQTETKEPVVIPLGELKPGPSFFALKTRDHNSQITGWVGPGIDGIFVAQYTEALAQRYRSQLKEVEAALTDPNAAAAEKEKALKLRERLGGDVTALDMAVAYQGDIAVPIWLDEVKDEAGTRTHLERLRRHGVTHLSLKIKDYEELANNVLLQFSDRGVDDARLIWGNQADQFTRLTRLAHETGLRIGLQVDAAIIDQFTNVLRSPAAKERVESARERGIVLNQGLDLLKVMVQFNELYRLELDFFNLRVNHPSREVKFRQNVEKLMEMLDALLIVTGPEGGSPAPWAQYATRISAAEVTPEAARAVLERSFPGLVMRARHRYAQSLFLDGESVDSILSSLDSKFPPLIGADGRVNAALADQLIQRIKTPSVSTLRALGVPEPMIDEVRQKAEEATEQSLREAISKKEEWVRFAMLGRALENGAAQQPILKRLQRPLDATIMALYRIQQTRMLMVGDTRPELALMTPKNRIVKPGGEATVTVRVKNAGNIPARYLVAGYLMGKDSGGSPNWPASSPLVQPNVEVLLKSGETQEVDVQVVGNVLAEEGKVSYRVLVRDANTLEHLPGVKDLNTGTYLGLSPREAELARVDGDLLVMAKPPAKLVTEEQEEWSNLRLAPLVRRFEQMEEARRARTGEQETDSAYQQGYEERLREFMEPFATVTVEETPNARNFKFIPKPIGLQEQIAKARADQRKEMEVITLVPEEPERFIPWLWRKFLGTALVSLTVIGIAGTLLGIYRSIRQSSQAAHHLARLRSEAVHMAQAGVVKHSPDTSTQAFNLEWEWSHYVGGFGAGWKQLWAYLHPEQGKVSRAFSAHGRYVIVLDDETETESRVVERRKLQHLDYFRRGAARVTFLAGAATVLIGGLKLAVGLAVTSWPQATASVVGNLHLGWLLIPWWPLAVAAIVLVVGLVMARSPPAQHWVSGTLYFFVDHVIRTDWAHRLFFLAAPLIFLGAATYVFLGLVMPVAAVAWIPIASVLVVGAAWVFGVFLAMGGVEAADARGWFSTVWRLTGAFGLAALGVSAVALLTGAVSWQFYLGAAIAVSLTWVLTKLFVSHDKPLQAFSEWLWSLRFPARYVLIFSGLYYVFTAPGPMLYAAWVSLFNPALPAASLAALAALGLWVWVGLGVAAAIVLWLLTFKFELGQQLPGQWRWPLRVAATLGVVSAALFFPLPGFPAIWAAFLLKIGLFTAATGQIGKAVEWYRDRGPGQRLGSAIFRGFFLGLVATVGFPSALFWIWTAAGFSANMALLLSFWLIAVPTALMISWWIYDHLRPVQFRIHDWYEAEEIRRIQHAMGIRHLLEAKPTLTSTFSQAQTTLLEISPGQLEDEFNRLADLAYLNLSSEEREVQKELIRKHFNIRLAPDQRPMLNYDVKLFDQAWVAAVQATKEKWHRGVPPIEPGGSFINRSPAQRVATLSPDQQRVLNWYYWWPEAEQEVEEEVWRQSNGAVKLADLPLADQEMAVAAFFNPRLKRHADEIFNQDQGTILRTSGGSLWTGDLRELSRRLRRDDHMAVIMPALILSLDISADPNKIVNWKFFKKSAERFGLLPAGIFFVGNLLQLALVNFTVPLGFSASMINRQSRGLVQGGNVLHTLRASADAGMAGYQSAMGYVILVIGRWLEGFLFTLMEVYLGRWVGRGDLEEYIADQYWIPKAGTIEEYVEKLLQRKGFSSWVAAYYASITGEENPHFDMGYLEKPIRLDQIYWDSKADGDITDSETFGQRMLRQQLAGVLAWRTLPPGGHEFYPVRFEIVRVADLGNGMAAELLSDGKTYRLRDADGALTYFDPLSGEERKFLDDWVVSHRKGDWDRVYSALQEEKAFMLRTQLGAAVSDAEAQRLNRQLQLINGILGKIQTLAEAPEVRRLSQEPGKFHLVLPPGHTKGVNVGAGLSDYLGMVKPKLKLSRQDDGKWRASVIYQRTEDDSFPEWEKARLAVQDRNNRQAGQRGQAGQKAADDILRWRDEQILRDGKLSEVSSTPKGEWGHNQVRDASGQRQQLWMNFWRRVLEWESRKPTLQGLIRRLPASWQGNRIVRAVNWFVENFTHNSWWTLKLAVAVALFALFSWPGALVLFLPGPTFLANLWGRIHPISFIGNVPYNKLQGMKGHYDSKPVDSAFDQLEQRLGAKLGAAPADSVYEEELVHGEETIASRERLDQLAELYHKVLKYDHVPYRLGRAWWNPFAWTPMWTNSSRPVRGFMAVEPRLASAIASLSDRLPAPAPPTRNRWEAREQVEAMIIKEIEQLGVGAAENRPAPRVRRAAFEAFKWRTVGELMDLGGSATADQYSRSRESDVIRLGDVNAQYGVQGQDRLKRMMLALGYPAVVNRSWTQHSEAALYEGVSPPSMMYSPTNDQGIQQILERARAEGFFVEAIWREADGIHAVLRYEPELSDDRFRNMVDPAEANKAYNKEKNEYLLAAMKILGLAKTQLLLLGSNRLSKEIADLSKGKPGIVRRINPSMMYSPTNDQGIQQILERARAEGFFVEAIWREADGIHAVLRYEPEPPDDWFRNMVDPAQANEAYNKEQNEYLLAAMKILGLVETRLPGSNRLREEIADLSKGKPGIVRRINPLKAALTQRRKGEKVREFYMRNTYLQPDLETTHQYMIERSRQVLLEVESAPTVAQVDRYLQVKAGRQKGAPFVALSRMNMDWRDVGYQSSDFEGAFMEMIQEMRRTGGGTLAAPMGFWQRHLRRWFGMKMRYSKEVILLQIINGVTEDQLIRDPPRTGRVVDLKWTNLDSHFDASEWRLTIGSYLWPGTTLGRVPLWMRRSTMDRAPPIPFLEMVRLMEMPPWLAVASGFNRLWSDGLSLPQLLTEDGRHGALNRLGMPSADSPEGNTLHPTVNAWNAHWIPFMQLALSLRKRDKGTQRALQFFVGMAMEESFMHLFDHPLFGRARSGQAEGRPEYTQIQQVFQNLMGLQAFLRDEIATAGASGAGTFSYGFSGYTASWLAGRRVGPFPPGHVHAYWKYREFLTLDQMLGGSHEGVTHDRQLKFPFHEQMPEQWGGRSGLFFRMMRLIQQRHRPELGGASRLQDLLQGDPIDPWAVLAVMGARIEQSRRTAPNAQPSRKAAIRLTHQQMERELALAGLEETEADQTPLPPASSDDLASSAVSLSETRTGLEEVQVGTPQAWASAAGQVIPVSVAGEGRASSGRAVVFDPAQVHIRQIVNPDVTGGAWNWRSIRGHPKDQQPGRPLSDLVRDTQQWGLVEVPAGARLGLAMHSFQTNFWEPQGFLVTQGRLVALPGVTWSHEPEVFVLDAGQLGLRRLSLADGIPQAQEIQEAVVGPILIRNGQDVSEKIEQYPAGSPDPSAVTWDPRTTAAAFSALGRTAEGRLIFLSLVGEPQTGLRQATVGDVAQAILALGTEDDPVVEGMLLGGSMDVQQWVAGDGEKPGVLGQHNNAPHESERPLNAAILVYLPVSQPVVSQPAQPKPLRSGLEEMAAGFQETTGTRLQSPVTPTNVLETRVAVISARAAEGTGLEELAGQPKQVGEGWLWVLPPQATAEALSEWVMPFMGMPNVVFQEYGGLEEFVGFNAMVKGLASVQEPRVLTGTTLLEILRQIFANLTGVAPEAVSDDQLAGMEEALGLGIQL